jgi:hypothetical protein
MSARLFVSAIRRTATRLDDDEKDALDIADPPVGDKKPTLSANRASIR